MFLSALFPAQEQAAVPAGTARVGAGLGLDVDGPAPGLALDELATTADAPHTPGFDGGLTAGHATQLWHTKQLADPATPVNHQATAQAVPPAPAPAATQPRQPTSTGGDANRTRRKDDSGGGAVALPLRHAPAPPSLAGVASEPSDDDILASLLSQRTALTTTLSDRLTHLRLLSMHWSSGDVTASVNHLNQIAALMAGQDRESSAAGRDSALAIATDFLGRVDLRTEALTLDTCQRLLPLVHRMLASSLAAPKRGGRGAITVAKPRRVVVAVRSALKLLRMFGRLLSDTLRSPPAFSNNVDLGREERYLKCEACHDSLVRIHDAVAHVHDQSGAAALNPGETFSPNQESSTPLPQLLDEFLRCFSDYINARL